MLSGKRATLRGLRRQEEFTGWLFVAPAALGIIIFSVYPVIFSLYASLTEWDLISAPRWIGTRNYTELFTADRFFKVAMQNTVEYAIGTVVPSLVLALVFAVLLNQEIRGRFLYRAIYFVPVVAPGVAISILWVWIYEPNFGIMNFILEFFGIQGPRWLGSSKWAMPAVIISAVWGGLGYNIVIFLAGLQAISKDYYEAASIDGATAFHRFRHVTLPLLSPVTFFVLVLGVIGAFQVFTAPFVMTGGGPANATMTLVLHLYRQAFQYQHMGLASALAYVLFIVVVVLTVINFRLQRYWVFYEEAK